MFSIYSRIKRYSILFPFQVKLYVYQFYCKWYQSTNTSILVIFFIKSLICHLQKLEIGHFEKSLYLCRTLKTLLKIYPCSLLKIITNKAVHGFDLLLFGHFDWKQNLNQNVLWSLLFSLFKPKPNILPKTQSKTPS